MADHLPLSALEREACSAVAVIGMHARHVRAVLGPRPIRRELQARKAEDKAYQLVLGKGSEHQAAIMDRR